MCRDRDSTRGMSVPPAGGDANVSRRLPPRAIWPARASLVVGVILILRSLPMKADFNPWNNTPYSTYSGIFGMTLFLVIFYPTIPLVAWFYTGLLTCVINALRRGGPGRSLLVPVLSAPLCASWVLYMPAAAWRGRDMPPLHGYNVFAVGCTLVFFSTLPGLYYWIKLRLPRKNKNGTF